MKHLLILTLFISSLFSLSTLPFATLRSELSNAKESLVEMQDRNSLQGIDANYLNEYQTIVQFEKSILQDGSINKQESKLYLKKLRTLNGTYEELLSSLRAQINKSIHQDDYTLFLHLVESHLPRLFEKSSFTYNAINYYKQNEKIQKSDVMLKEIEYAKAKKVAEKALQEEPILEQKSQEQVTATKKVQKRAVQTNNIDVRYMKSAYLDPKLRYKREQAFTPWMSKKEHQQRYDNGYYKKAKVYPAYVEVDKEGNRRVLEIPYEPKFYWSSTSGRLFRSFKKIHIRHTLNGKRLLFVHIQKVDGVKIYTGIWITSEVLERELAKLNAYGIYGVYQ